MLSGGRFGTLRMPKLPKGVDRRAYRLHEDLKTLEWLPVKGLDVLDGTRQASAVISDIKSLSRVKRVKGEKGVRERLRRYLAPPGPRPADREARKTEARQLIDQLSKLRREKLESIPKSIEKARASLLTTPGSFFFGAGPTTVENLEALLYWWKRHRLFEGELQKECSSLHDPAR